MFATLIPSLLNYYFNVYYQNSKSRFTTRLCSIVVYQGLFPGIIGFGKAILEHFWYSSPSKSGILKGEGLVGISSPSPIFLAWGFSCVFFFQEYTRNNACANSARSKRPEFLLTDLF